MREKRIQFAYLRDRIGKKLESWQNREFSEGGKEILIKAVLQAIPSYAMSCFRIPSTLCDDIERMIAKFWWGGGEHKKGVHWRSWETMCLPKEMGGMGFKHLMDFNRALLAKQLWRISCNPTSLIAKVYKARYFKHTNVMEAELGSNPSFIWRSLLWSRPTIEAGIKWRIGDGKTIQIFKDPWVNELDNGRIRSRIASGSNVARFILPNFNWDEQLVRQAFLPYEAEAILRTPIGGKAGGDAMFWKHDEKGKYSVRSGYHHYRASKRVGTRGEPSNGGKAKREQWGSLWKLNLPPKIRIFWWKVLNYSVATEGNLFKQYVPTPPHCFLCGHPSANTTHAIFFCKAVRHNWKKMEIWHLLKPMRFLSTEEIIFRIEDFKSKEGVEMIVALAWGIWKERCKTKHGEEAKRRSERYNVAIDGDWAVDYVHSYQKANEIMKSITANGRARRMVEATGRRRQGFTLTTDASIMEERGIAVVGYSIWSEEGVLMAAGGSRIGFTCNIMEAELKGVLVGLAACKRMGQSDVQIWTDAMEVVRAVGTEDKFLSPVGFAIEDFREEVKSGLVGGVSYIPRDNNRVAHEIARWAINSTDPHDWIGEEIPRWIRNLPPLNL